MSLYGLGLVIFSLIVPGGGQFLSGRVFMAVALFGLCCVFWLFGMGWIIHIASGLEALHHEEEVSG